MIIRQPGVRAVGSCSTKLVEVVRSNTETGRNLITLTLIDIRRGLVVRISAFHAGGPGSIPGVGIPFFVWSL